MFPVALNISGLEMGNARLQLDENVQSKIIVRSFRARFALYNEFWLDNFIQLESRISHFKSWNVECKQETLFYLFQSPFLAVTLAWIQFEYLFFNRKNCIGYSSLNIRKLKNLSPWRRSDNKTAEHLSSFLILQ